ncbi:MAG: NUDIX domain-containing protein [Phyllobacteriaceae bacterium]|nr:NUDIX domain-containing protein [Phyllobacteriaceae bacterium]
MRQAKHCAVLDDAVSRVTPGHASIRDITPAMTLSRLLSRARNRLFHVYFLMTRPMTLGARVALFNAVGEICLIRHGYVPGWQLPGGGVDPGETIEAAAIRELAEEAGHVPTAPLSLFAVYKNTKASRRDHVLLYRCEASTPIDGFEIDGREITGCGFFAVNALPDGTTGSTRRRIAELAGEAVPDPFW